jgi:ribosomal subunit interface protein
MQKNMININVKATNMDLTPAIRAFVEKKVGALERLLARYELADLQIWVEVGPSTKHHQSGEIFRAEMQIRIPHIDGGLRAVSEKEDLYAAIDDANDQLKRELRRAKTKERSVIMSGARKIKNIFLRKNG